MLVPANNDSNLKNLYKHIDILNKDINKGQHNPIAARLLSIIRQVLDRDTNTREHLIELDSKLHQIGEILNPTIEHHCCSCEDDL